MTPDQTVLLVLGFASQIAGLCVLGVLVYYQTRGLGEVLRRLSERVSPGEAAIILQQQRLMTRFDELRPTAPEGGVK